MPQASRNRSDLETVYRHGALYADYEKTVSLQFYLKAKRAFDLVGASLGLLLLTPLLLVVVILIKVEDPRGKILFRQVRVGRNGTPFHMYKFRSMVSDAEQLLEGLKAQNEVEGAMFKIKNDPRITKVGKFIRKTSIDELPQLWNVVVGNMSLVGPRPALPSEVSEYSSYDKLRLRVMPGCTGLWQVNGRSSLSFKQMVDLDLAYIERRSLLFDLKLVLVTVLIMFRTKDAY
ncbi:sugar transferase [Paenibacillus sp. NEAU-GSW1]|uniref:sugar transferase n=1 Tax=Paenibacillus sp. NEAU-GSW1 TaxID=2682486 RepID=UPI0012E167A5|nr:sugar transferase [Paenibacillus sp. NEAU-GSW1]MUT68044.1 sugar transferase [Paenibacillus sp. NEAU-GSW1]